MDEKVLTIDDLAKHWKIHRRTIERLIEKRQLKGFRVGKQIRFKETQIKEFENKMTMKYGLMTDWRNLSQEELASLDPAAEW